MQTEESKLPGEVTRRDLIIGLMIAFSCSAGMIMFAIWLIMFLMGYGK
jgi:hypothetical protein